MCFLIFSMYVSGLFLYFCLNFVCFCESWRMMFLIFINVFCFWLSVVSNSLIGWLSIIDVIDRKLVFCKDVVLSSWLRILWVMFILCLVIVDCCRFKSWLSLFVNLFWFILLFVWCRKYCKFFILWEFFVLEWILIICCYDVFVIFGICSLMSEVIGYVWVELVSIIFCLKMKCLLLI